MKRTMFALTLTASLALTGAAHAAADLDDPIGGLRFGEPVLDYPTCESSKNVVCREDVSNGDTYTFKVPVALLLTKTQTTDAPIMATVETFDGRVMGFSMTFTKEQSSRMGLNKPAKVGDLYKLRDNVIAGIVKANDDQHVKVAVVRLDHVRVTP